MNLDIYLYINIYIYILKNYIQTLKFHIHTGRAVRSVRGREESIKLLASHKRSPELVKK